MPPKAIPDRWIPYKPCGEIIEGTRFICFKVPLKLSVQSNVPDITKIWDIPTVLADIPKLGAVIDLTNTARYYNPAEFLKANVLYRKILMPGRMMPPESAVMEFTNAVDEFLARDSDSLIGVHCTHGLNRTGYMVCRYMRDRLRIPAQEAITRFEVARGYKMERDIYINDILGTDQQSHDVGKRTEVMSVENRRNDVNYRSPLGDGYDSPTVDNSKRFGNSRSTDDRHGSNRFSSQNSNSRDNNGLFSCYTNRYKDERKSSSRTSDRSRSNRSPLSWRRREESSGEGSSKRNRTEDSSGYNKHRGDDRSKTRDHN